MGHDSWAHGVAFFVDQLVLGKGRWGQRRMRGSALLVLEILILTMIIQKKRIFMVLDIHSEDDVQRFE